MLPTMGFTMTRMPLLLVLLAAAGAAQADVGLFNTGVDAQGHPLATGTVDPHYTLVAAGGGAQSFAVDDAAGYPGFWLAPSTTSKWVAPQVSGGFASSNDAGMTVYLYQTSFDLSGVDLSSASIAGLAVADNEVQDILLNGQSIGFTTAVGYSAFTGFSITSGFVAGINTLSFQVGNYAGPTGLRTELTGNFVSSNVPEPSAWALGSAGLLALAAWRRRQRSNTERAGLPAPSASKPA